MFTTGNRMVEDSAKKSDPTLPARPVPGPAVEARPVKPAPDAGLQPVKPAPAQPQGAPVIPASALKPTYSRSSADPDAPAAAGTTVTNSSPFTAPTGTPASAGYPAVVPGKVYTQEELVAFQQAMSAADMAAMRGRQQTMYRAGKYSDKPSGDGWISIPLASGGYYEYKAEPVWMDHWASSPNGGTGGGAGAGTGTGGNVSTGAGGSFGSADNLTSLLEEWKKAAAEQANGQIDYAVQQAVTELERALEDSKALYREQAESVARDEMQGLDNSALYAEVRGDKGGIGQAQYNEIRAAAAQNRLAVQQAQTKLATDTSRQIADLRARGEFEKADKLLEITQTYLSQLISLEQWQAEFGLSREKFLASLDQWRAEFDLELERLGFQKEQFAHKALSDRLESSRELAFALMEMGITLTPEQLAAMGLSEEQVTEWLWLEQMEDIGADTMDQPNGLPAVYFIARENLERLRANGATTEEMWRDIDREDIPDWVRELLAREFGLPYRVG